MIRFLRSLWHLGGGWIGESRESWRKEIMKILTRKSVTVVDLSVEREGMWRKRYSEGSINSSWGLIGCKGKEELQFLVSQLKSHFLRNGFEVQRVGGRMIMNSVCDVLTLRHRRVYKAV